MGSTYLTLAGPPPSLTKRAWFDWYAKLLERRIRECDVARTNTFYIDSAAANDDGVGSIADPWKTMAKVDSVMAADTAFLFLRGKRWVAEDTTITVDVDNVTIGAYGDGDPPVLSFFTELGGWTVEDDPAYGKLVGGTPFWAYRTDAKYTTPLAKVADLAECKANNNSFALDGTTVYVNVDGVDPDTLGATPIGVAEENTTDGFVVTGNGCLIENIIVDGYGLNDNTTDDYPIRISITGTDSCVVRDCEGYYASKHGISYLSSAGVGGQATFIRCKSGGCVTSTSSIFNAFNNTGGTEVIWHQCETALGVLPQATGAHATAGTGFLTHTGTGTFDLIINYGCTIGNGSFGLRSVDQFSDTTPATTFVVKQTCISTGTGDIVNLFLLNDGVQRSCCVYDILVRAAATEALGNKQQTGLLINSYLNLDYTEIAQAFGLWNPGAGIQSTAEFYHNHIHMIVDDTFSVTLDHDSRFGATQSDGVRFKNNILTGDDTSSGDVTLGLGNNLVNAGFVDNNAYFDIAGGGDTTTDSAYGNDANLLELDRPWDGLAAVEFGDDLYQAGSSTIGVDYDFNLNRRSSNPSIGPIESLDSAGYGESGVHFTGRREI